MMSQTRCALVVDDDQNSLGEIALRILRLRIDVYYAKGCDEAWLLAQQEAERIRAVLFPPALDLERVTKIVEVIRAPDTEDAPTLVVVGARPGAKACEQLRARGVDLALWEPFDESSLRSIVSAAIAPRSCNDTRREARLPTTLLGRAFVGIRRRDAIVATLSSGGAFLETPLPLPEETQITLEIALPDGVITVKARVIYAFYQGEGQEQLARPTGMGVQFIQVNPTAEAQLQRFLEDNERRFRV